MSAYNSTLLEFCTPSTLDATAVSCMHNRYASSLSWWPYPTAYCFSSSLVAYASKDQRFKVRNCDLTKAGKALRVSMTGEGFLGSEVVIDEEKECQAKVDHTVLVIGRQDQVSQNSRRG